MRFRDSEILISNALRWKLTRIVKATQPTDPMEPNGSVDALAEKILTDWIAQHHPKLAELWDRRQALDTEAETEVSKPPF